MKTLIALRIPERNASKYLDRNVGKRLGSTVRRVTIDVSDPLFQRIGEIQRELIAQGDCFFYGWFFRQYPDDRDVARAEIFQFIIDATFEPAGEYFGTNYDETETCPGMRLGTSHCGPAPPEYTQDPSACGSRQNNSARRVGVSERVHDLLRQEQATGVVLVPVEHAGRSRPLARWWQLRVTSSPVHLTPPTRFGVNPFDADPTGQYSCPVCTTVGLAVISPDV